MIIFSACLYNVQAGTIFKSNSTLAMVKRVLVTDAAKEVIDQLTERHGPLMFHQSGGCCDGSQPMCFEKGDFKVGSSDVKIGEIHGCDFFMNADQFQYWQYTQLTVDIVKGRGASFSERVIKSDIDFEP